MKKLKLTVVFLSLLSFTRAELSASRQIGRIHVPDAIDGGKSQPDFLDRIKESSKFFQDLYAAQLSPDELEFGHVRESPDSWEQRFEKIDVGKHRYQGKVKWGDKHGGYGEHYYDYNHNGHNDDSNGEVRDGNGKYNQKLIKLIPLNKLEKGRHLLDKGEVEFVNDKAKHYIVNNYSGLHGGNYKAAE